MQELGKPGPPAREKSVQELERDRIADEYDRQHGKGIYAESTDPDSDEYYLDTDERRELYSERLKEDQNLSQLDRRNAAMSRIFAKDAPPAEGPDDMIGAEEAWAAFRERHPELSSKDCEVINSEKFYGQDPELLDLKAEAWANPGSPSVAAKVLDRAADILARKRKEATDRAYVQYLAKSRMSVDESARLAKLQAAIKAGKTL